MPKRHTYVDQAIAKATLELNIHEPNSDRYGVVLERLGKLQKIRQEEKPNLPSPDTVLLAVVNLVGIGMIVRHEHLNVITSKAMSMIKKA